MHLDLCCPSCALSFPLPSDSPAAEFLAGMAERDIWCPLGDGETIEDNVYGALVMHEDFCCPECSQPVTVSQESLNRLARELLVQW